MWYNIYIRCHPRKVIKMEICLNNIKIKIDWKTIVGLSSSIGGYVLLNKLSERGQFDSLNIDVNNKRLSLN